MTERVTLFEMGPRDGLQNEATLIATADKIELVDRLSRCGFSKIEVTSFVSPRWVPQLADCLLYTSPSPRDGLLSRMPSSA